MLVAVTLVDVEVVSTAVVVGAAVVVGSGATVVAGSGAMVVDVDEVDEGTTMVVSVSVEVYGGRGYSLFRLAAPATGTVVAATEVVDAGTEVAAPGVSVTVMVTTVTSTSVTKTRLLRGLAAAPKTHKALTNNEPFILYFNDVTIRLLVVSAIETDQLRLASPGSCELREVASEEDKEWLSRSTA